MNRVWIKRLFAAELFVQAVKGGMQIGRAFAADDLRGAEGRIEVLIQRCGKREIPEQDGGVKQNILPAARFVIAD